MMNDIMIEDGRISYKMCEGLTPNSTVTETYTIAFPDLLGPGSCNLLPI